MNGLLPLPPLARTVIYYVLSLANVAMIPLVATHVVDPVWAVSVVGVAGVFGFTLSASNVPTPPEVTPSVN